MSSRPLSVVAFAVVATAACRASIPETRDILFQAQQPGGTEDIYALRVRDAAVRRLILADTLSSRALPAWSPNQRSIVFVREFGDSGQLYILDSLQAVPRQLAQELTGFFAFPDWSPSGRQVLFNAGPEADHLATYMINSNGSGLRLILGDTLAYRCPSWSPDGSSFAVAAYHAGGSQIMTMDLGTGFRRTLLAPDTAYVDCPHWSRQGTELLVTVYRGTMGLYDTTPRPYGANLATLDLQTLEFDAITDNRGFNNYGRWSAKGDWVVFQSDRHVRQLPEFTGEPLFDSLEIYVVRGDGSDLRRMTRNTHFDAHPSW